jgi:hypothetical protein
LGEIADVLGRLEGELLAVLVIALRFINFADLARVREEELMKAGGTGVELKALEGELEEEAVVADRAFVFHAFLLC